MNTDLMFSSQTDLWYTPQDFFDKYDSIHGFTTDVCALPSNAKCMHYFTPEDDFWKTKWIAEVEHEGLFKDGGPKNRVVVSIREM